MSQPFYFVHANSSALMSGQSVSPVDLKSLTSILVCGLGLLNDDPTNVHKHHEVDLWLRKTVV